MLIFLGDVKNARQITLGLVLRSCTSFDAADWSHSTQIQILDARYKAGTWYKPLIGFAPNNGFIVHFDGEEFYQVKHLGDTQRREPK
jgi:hypothetical protein